jgi:predicted lipase
MKLTGGSLKVNELMEILKASYLENPDKTIYGFTLDEKLSNLYGKVYVDIKKKKAVIVYRGTKETSDWLNNIVYASSNAYKQTSRYKTAKKMYDAALKKYKNFQFESIGHSQGSLLARLLSDKSINSIQLNPAYKAETLKDNEYIIRSSGDVVSSLTVPKKMINSVLYPSWTKEHMITIPAETNNPITEHRIDILNRLDQNKKIGRGGCKKCGNQT